MAFAKRLVYAGGVSRSNDTERRATRGGPSWSILRATIVAAVALAVEGCTIHHSKQALWTQPTDPPAKDATFVSEEDSGLQVFGFFLLNEPDHYAVLLDRARRNNRCARLEHAQLDFYTDHWLIVAFPIARVTMVCTRPEASARNAVEAEARATASTAHPGAP